MFYCINVSDSVFLTHTPQLYEWNVLSLLCLVAEGIYFVLLYHIHVAISLIADEFLARFLPFADIVLLIQLFSGLIHLLLASCYSTAVYFSSYNTQSLFAMSKCCC